MFSIISLFYQLYLDVFKNILDFTSCTLVLFYLYLIDVFNVIFISPALLHALRRGVRPRHRPRVQPRLHRVRRVRRGRGRYPAGALPHRKVDHPHRHDHLPSRRQHSSA